MEETYTGGVILGIPLFIIVCLICIALIVWGIFGEYLEVCIPIGIGFLVVSIAFFVLVWWPFDMDYHKWHPVAGTVAQVDKRLIGTGESGLGEVYLITYKDNEQQYRCDDTRCAGVAPGDELDLMCKPDFQWASTHGWSCRFYELRK